MLCRRELVVGPDTVLLWDADGNLFPSEGPAFDASNVVTSRLLESLGSDERWTSQALRSRSLGKNFRSLAVELARSSGAPLSDEELEAWVERENEVVMERLGGSLRPDDNVLAAVRRLAGSYRMAVVSSSKLDRLAVCFTATGLDPYFPADLRFSAQDSLPSPTSKPDPAVYLHAVREMAAAPELAIAVEDAVAGVASATAAGLQSIGNLAFVPPSERSGHGEALLAEGASVVIEDWSELDALLPTFTGAVATRST
jgi:beta-phosphoglucomutase-like phosphatase (HAD superfamily)